MKKQMIGFAAAIALALALAGCVQIDIDNGRDGFVSLAEAVFKYLLLKNIIILYK